MYKKHKQGYSFLFLSENLNIMIGNYNVEDRTKNYSIQVSNDIILTKGFISEFYLDCTKDEFMEAYNTVLELLKNDVI